MDIRSLIEVSDSQESIPPPSSSFTQSWDSENGPIPDNSLLQTPRKQYATPTTRSDRIRIKTCLDFNIPFEEITKKYGYTRNQILRARHNTNVTPRKKGRCGRRPNITTPQRQRLED